MIISEFKAKCDIELFDFVRLKFDNKLYLVEDIRTIFYLSTQTHEFEFKIVDPKKIESPKFWIKREDFIYPLG